MPSGPKVSPLVFDADHSSEFGLFYVVITRFRAEDQYLRQNQSTKELEVWLWSTHDNSHLQEAPDNHCSTLQYLPARCVQQHCVNSAVLLWLCWS